MSQGDIMLHFCMAAVILLGIILAVYAAIVLVDELNMGRKFGEESRRSYAIWGSIFIMSVASVVISWINLPGSKWFVAIYFAPALVLILMALLFEGRQWFGTTLVVALCFVWVACGGFLASAAIYNFERYGEIRGEYSGCYYERVAGSLRYEWNCPRGSR